MNNIPNKHNRNVSLLDSHWLEFISSADDKRQKHWLDANGIRGCSVLHINDN